MRKKIIKGFDSYCYREVRKIVSWKEGFVWRTIPIGFIHQNDIQKYSKDEYVICSISTKTLTKDKIVLEDITLEPFLE